jgi:hypothetical protein
MPCITDVPYYLTISSQLHFPLSPYSQFDLEYPPFSLLPIYLAGFLAPIPSFNAYFFSFSLLMLVCDVICLCVCQTYCRKRLCFSDYEISYMTLIYALFGLLSFRLLYHRLDLVVSLFFALSLLLFCAKKKELKMGFFLNSFLGFFYKIVPIINAPLACIFKAASCSKDLKSFIKKTIIYAISIALILFCGIMFFEIISKHNFLRNLFYHQQRGIQIESSFAMFFFFSHFLSKELLPIVFNYKSFNLESPQLLDTIAKSFGHLALFGFYLAVFWILARKKIAKEKVKISEEIFLEATLISMLLFLAFQRVLSPQFFIWLIPILSIFLVKNPSLCALLASSSIFFLTFVIFSINYPALLNQEPILLSSVILRNLILIAFSCVLTWKFLKKLQKNDGK